MLTVLAINKSLQKVRQGPKIVHVISIQIFKYKFMRKYKYSTFYNFNSICYGTRIIFENMT